MNEVAKRIAATPFKGARRLVAITGAPASGKSTIAETLQGMIPKACVVPMDGFHLDNAVLDARALRSRKGAPETFDVDGFVALVAALKHHDHVPYPLFDRANDRAIPNAAQVGPEVETVLIEGNYLLLKSGGWEALRPHWDLSLFLDVSVDELERRLMDRWTSLGLSLEVAKTKTYGNDLLNAKTVIEDSYLADMII